MKTTLLTLALFMSFNALAHDSLWSLCKTQTTLFEETETLVLNEYEHRNSRGDGRDTDLTLIFGGHLLTGTFDSSEVSTGPLKLASKNSRFEGQVTLNDDSVELNGVLNLDGMKTDLKAKFSCEVLRD